jgi:hypothetical protein
MNNIIRSSSYASEHVPTLGERTRYTRTGTARTVPVLPLVRTLTGTTRSGPFRPGVPTFRDGLGTSLCVPKKNGKLRTPFDCRQRNFNTVKDATPFPDQDRIRNDVARACYCSKLDMSEAFEQIRIIPCDVHKTAFSTTQGTFLSNVIQQGDCNGPSTFQRLMTPLFRPYLGDFIHVYLDDIFIFSDSIDDHEKYLRIVFDTLREQKLNLSKDKIDLYSVDTDCLGFRIDSKGIHYDTTKMEKIAQWSTPTLYHQVQQFNGLVNYIAPFLPNIAEFTGPLAASCKNQRKFLWTPALQKCFNRIKETVANAPVLKPIDPRSPDPIYLITDASVTGIGAMLGQGRDWQHCRPAGFMSKKFTDAQYNYATAEQELIALLEGLHTFEDKLIGRKFIVCTDHESLKYIFTQKNLSRRQSRWIDYLSRFDFKIEYIQGAKNIVADPLSRYYKNDSPDTLQNDFEHVTIDARLDPKHEDLSIERRKELNGLRIYTARRKKQLEELSEDRAREAAIMREAVAKQQAKLANQVEASASEVPDVVLTDQHQVAFDLSQLLAANYDKNSYFKKIIEDPTAFPLFKVKDRLIYFRPEHADDLLCIPREALLRGRRLTELIIDHAHNIIGHFRPA